MALPNIPTDMDIIAAIRTLEAASSTGGVDIDNALTYAGHHKRTVRNADGSALQELRTGADKSLPPESGTLVASAMWQETESSSIRTIVLYTNGAESARYELENIVLSDDESADYMRRLF